MPQTAFGFVEYLLILMSLAGTEIKTDLKIKKKTYIVL